MVGDGFLLGGEQNLFAVLDLLYENLQTIRNQIQLCAVHAAENDLTKLYRDDPKSNLSFLVQDYHSNVDLQVFHVSISFRYCWASSE